jgi:multisubunit Na+/H+ antiporter MnhF subunit
MVTEIIAPQPDTYKDKEVDLKKYYYDNYKVILGLAVVLQVCLLANLFVFFKGELVSMKVIGRVIMLCIMTPMVFINNKRLHEIGMTIFFLGFIYTIIKYHIFMV